MNETIPYRLSSPPRLKVSTNNSSPAGSFHSARDYEHIIASHPFDFSDVQSPQKPDSNPGFRGSNEGHTSFVSNVSSFYGEGGRSAATSMIFQQAPLEYLHSEILASPVTFNRSKEGRSDSMLSVSTGNGSYLTPISSHYSRSTTHHAPSSLPTPPPMTSTAMLNFNNSIKGLAAFESSSSHNSSKIPPSFNSDVAHIGPARDFKTVSYNSRPNDEDSSVYMWDEGNSRMSSQDTTELEMSLGMGFESPKIMNSPQHSTRKAQISPLTISQEPFPTIFGERNHDLPSGTSGAFSDSPRSDTKFSIEERASQLDKIIPNASTGSFVSPAYRLNSSNTSISSGKKLFATQGLHKLDTSFSNDQNAGYVERTMSNGYEIELKDLNSSIPPKSRRNSKVRDSLFFTLTDSRRASGSGELRPPPRRNSHTLNSIVKANNRLSISSTSNLINEEVTPSGFPGSHTLYSGASTNTANNAFIFNDRSSSKSRRVSSNASAKSFENQRIRRDLEYMEKLSKPISNQMSIYGNDDEINNTAEAARAFLDEEVKPSVLLYQKTKQYDHEGNLICSQSLETFLLVTFLMFPPLWLLLGAGFFDIVFNKVSRKTKQIALVLSGFTFALAIAGLIVGIVIGGS